MNRISVAYQQQPAAPWVTRSRPAFTNRLFPGESCRLIAQRVSRRLAATERLALTNFPRNPVGLREPPRTPNGNRFQRP